MAAATRSFGDFGDKRIKIISPQVGTFFATA
jgi:hypothetical protein